MKKDKDFSEDKTLLNEDVENLTDAKENENEETELKKKGKSEEKSEEEEEKKPIIDQKKAFLGVAGALVTGTVLGNTFSGDDSSETISVDADDDGEADFEISDADEDGIYTVSDDAEVTVSSVTDDGSSGGDSEELAGHVFNISTAPHVSEGTVDDSMSFSEAFAASREEMGPGAVFEWNGNLYNTFYATEVDESNNPIIDYPTTADDDWVHPAYEGTDTADTTVTDSEVTGDEAINEGDTTENEGLAEVVEDDIDELETDIEHVEVESENPELVDYDGEITSNVPEDVDDSILDNFEDEIASLEDDFSDHNEWTA